MKDVLEEIFDSKKKKRYQQKLTLREFSRFLGINVATLSRVFAGKETLSVRQAEKILANKNIDVQFKSKLVSMYFPSLSSSPLELASIRKKGSSFVQNEKKGVFDFTWVDLALLELLNLPGLSQNRESLARFLSVSLKEVSASLEKLKQHDLIYRTGGRYLKRDRNLILGPLDEDSLKKIREFHRNLAIRGTKELDKSGIQDFQSRLINSHIISTHSDKIPEAKKRIEAFQKELLEFLTEGEANEVYAMSHQFFSLARPS